MKPIQLSRRISKVNAAKALALSAIAALPLSALSGPIISVDLQSSYPGEGITYSGVESGAAAANSAFNAANVWNGLGTTGFTINNFSSGPLVDNTGAATTALFSISGTTSAYGVPNVYGELLGDYFYWNSGSLSSTISWDISGLVAGATYAFYTYGSDSNNQVPREYNMSVDTNGDAVLDTTVAVSSSAASSGTLIYLMADASGMLHGANTGTNGEANWAGFQLTQVLPRSTVPEPTSAALVLAALFGLRVSGWKTTAAKRSKRAAIPS